MATENSILLLSALPQLLGQVLADDSVKAVLAEAIKDALCDPDVLDQVKELLAVTGDFESDASEPKDQRERTEFRRQISTREAADMLGYHPKYLCRKATDWGLTKIHMSSRSCRFYLDEIEALMESNGWRVSA